MVAGLGAAVALVGCGSTDPVAQPAPTTVTVTAPVTSGSQSVHQTVSSIASSESALSTSTQLNTATVTKTVTAATSRSEMSGASGSPHGVGPNGLQVVDYDKWLRLLGDNYDKWFAQRDAVNGKGGWAWDRASCFFVYQINPAEASGYKYFGICGPARTPQTTTPDSALWTVVDFDAIKNGDKVTLSHDPGPNNYYVGSGIGDDRAQADLLDKKYVAVPRPDGQIPIFLE